MDIPTTLRRLLLRWQMRCVARHYRRPAPDEPAAVSCHPAETLYRLRTDDTPQARRWRRLKRQANRRSKRREVA